MALPPHWLAIGNRAVAEVASWLRSVAQRINRLFEGEAVDLSDENIVYVTVRYHPVVRLLRRCRLFWVDHWKWLIGTGLVIVGWIFFKH